MLQLAYYFLDKQYLIKDTISGSDTIYRSSDRSFEFFGYEPLEPGVYMLVFHPEMNYSQILINESEQHMNIAMDNFVKVSGDGPYAGFGKKLI